MKENDKRLECSEAKRRAIRETKLKTKLRRSSQIVKTFECKIKMSRLTSAQKEDFAKLFLEAKWFYNHVLSMKNDSVPKDIREVKLEDFEASATVAAKDSEQQALKDDPRRCSVFS